MEIDIKYQHTVTSPAQADDLQKVIHHAQAAHLFRQAPMTLLAGLFVAFII